MGLVVLVLFVWLLLHGVGRGWFSEEQHAGSPQAGSVSRARVEAKGVALAEAASSVGVANPKQILFGDLHVHSTFSFDAFTMSLPMAGGDGAHPVSDACDYARHCAELDFWSINDHAVTLTPRRWAETLDSIRECNEVSGDPSNPDLVSYLGWEWTQVGALPETHWGHKNVVLRDLEDERIPARPIAAGIPMGMENANDVLPPAAFMGALGLYDRGRGGLEFAGYQAELADVVDCPQDVSVRDLPLDCRESAATPEELFAKLHEWGHASMVIPHGTTWGLYTPLGSSWDKQLTSAQHDPKRQRLVEVFSGHGNSEEYRPFQEVIFDADGSRSCPPASDDFLPSCVRAGEIIEERCLSAGASEDECAERAATARQHFVDANPNAGFRTIPATEVGEWQDAGQCRDCFQPAFNYRPRSSVQYMLALARDVGAADPLRFRFGFIAASDNHSARPGTGYKEVSRREFTEARFGYFTDTPIALLPEEEPAPRSRAFEPGLIEAPLGAFEAERQASFFLNGGLAAVHASGRDRHAIWDAMQRREVYGTSGPRILLWFDLINAPGGRPMPMGSEVVLGEAPIFQVRAAGSFEQKPGCPADAASQLGEERLARLCQGECYHPSDARRPITRIEVVRVRSQLNADESVTPLVEDPWKVIECPADGQGCQTAFTDASFGAEGRDASYYVRAVEATSPAVQANPLGCEYDENGRCARVNPCFGRPWDDECLADTEERAWSSPIYVGRATPMLAATR
jgi:hypothetical protein